MGNSSYFHNLSIDTFCISFFGSNVDLLIEPNSSCHGLRPERLRPFLALPRAATYYPIPSGAPNYLRFAISLSAISGGIFLMAICWGLWLLSPLIVPSNRSLLILRRVWILKPVRASWMARRVFPSQFTCKARRQAPSRFGWATWNVSK